jgi:hypothetical protein
MIPLGGTNDDVFPMSGAALFVCSFRSVYAQTMETVNLRLLAAACQSSSEFSR